MSSAKETPIVPEKIEMKSTKPGLEALLRELSEQRLINTEEPEQPSNTLIDNPGFDRCFNKFDRCFNKFDRCFNKFDRCFNKFDRN